MSTEEDVEILDEDGKKTGQITTRTPAHKRSLRHGVIHLWVYNSKGQLLMQKRHPKKSVWPNAWDPTVAGHISAGESPEDAVVKEATEELGLRINSKEIKLLGKFKFSEEMSEWVNKTFIFTYIAQKDVEIDDLVFEQNEVSGARWINVDELEKMLNDPTEIKNFSGDSFEGAKAAINYMNKKRGGL
jgi:isopentenyl-diphosphate delta-isomerase